ncbi:MAG: hypothetical protein K0R53_2055, partial [Burkholderiales bacterium]|nr:hypothetical protein [Burkholderiales bacterium]
MIQQTNPRDHSTDLSLVPVPIANFAQSEAGRIIDAGRREPDRKRSQKWRSGEMRVLKAILCAVLVGALAGP